MDPTTAMYVAQMIHGLAYGMVLFLLASGLTLIFGMMGILNLAHASFLMLSAYICYSVLDATGNFWLALILAPLATAMIGIMIERFLLRKIRGAGHIGELILTVGLMMIIMESVKIFWGTDTYIISVPPSLAGLVDIFGMEYPIYRIFIIVLALAILCFMMIILYKTRLGMIVRAGVSDAEMVGAVGINMPLVFMVVFGVGSWLAGVAGVAIAPLLSVFPGMADQIGMEAFVIVVVGGFGSLLGAFVASIFFGLLNSFGIQFIPRLAPVLMFLCMVLVLSFKPMGLFGERE
ncbi:MAG: branched-chain amino acid ABC transporter permease [Deltaproteobacteria bacterium]|jgi:branched-chain amino acid transport system permease protein|nr:branched-chain amino acid ABC transporter permease [Deltaproteobacteria bacterium]MBT4265240.1 branched-chain amino acid ABC transporter permease [Deltaproteobacteria bacterium]MBT4639590.1 branched-chain amino acid ABC transporter permease [Deltaproteobacteria bacterium]MBT6503977.1 branched-chain amino acid ABC transporter permease [Deltaproteobacteria bacterium]MBT6616346.1 branched-chain amino acid ABC transporter permease [Deltaproteobacteria bacterium]